MSATTVDRATLQWGFGVMIEGEWPVAATTKIPGGVLTARNTSGYAVNASDAASLTFAGISKNQADNTSGAAAALNVKTHRKGVFRLGKTGTITAADIGKDCYVSDNQTIALTGTSHALKCGKLAGLVDSDVWVEIDSAVDANAATS
jgi:hypothetical protein